MRTSRFVRGSRRIAAAFLAVLTMLSTLPLTAAPTSAASDIDVRDNVYLDALGYAGFKMSQFKADGKLFVVGASRGAYRSPIPYASGCTGLETTSAGKPDINRFKSGGLVCASYVTYVYFNYLSHVAGVDMTKKGMSVPASPRQVTSWKAMLDGMVSKGTAKKVGIGSAKPGDIVIFGDCDHIAIYAGRVNGADWVTHIGGSEGPDIENVAYMEKNGVKLSVTAVYDMPNPWDESGSIEVNKKDPKGKALAGAEFEATNTATKKVYSIGPTNSKGYAKTDDEIPYGTYTVKETKFPTGYQAHGQTSWTVTVSAANNGVVTIDAVNEEKDGTCQIIKKSDDGHVEGITFRVTGNGVDKTVKTNDKGVILMNLRPGTYTVTELTPDKYEPQKSQTVTVVREQTATVTFQNTSKRGTLKVIKTSEDNFVAGMTFHLFGTSASGDKVDMYQKTDATGVATFKDVLIGTNYTLEEVDTPSRYVIPEKQTAAIEWNKVTNKSVHNVLKKWQLTVVKKDDTNGTLGAGDASVVGAEYTLYDKNDKALKTYTVDRDGAFTTDAYSAGNGYYLLETKAPTGYRADTTKHTLDNYTSPLKLEKELTASKTEIGEAVEVGTVSLVKFTTDGELINDFKVPEEGAEFQVYLKSAGSYDAAVASGDDRVYDHGTVDSTGNVLWENGQILSKELAYGTYVVHQVSGWEGRKLLDDFEVEIKADHQNHPFTVENPIYETKLVVNKRDAETGSLIVETPAKFKIRDLETGKFVTYTMEYPEVKTIDEFQTNGGSFTLPVPLVYGDYELIETQAPEGYVLNKTPIKFSVTEKSAAVTTLDVRNTPQKGTIEVSKTGEVFSSVTEADGVYQPVYAEKGLAGAVYEVTAAEDVTTPDGTLRYHKGDVVATLTTGEDGKDKTAPLYLGQYAVKEIKAPYGMVLNDEVHPVELAYAGQDVKVVEAATSFVNERQKVQIDLQKVMEQSELFGIGMNGEIKAVQFGLFAAEKLTAADGTVIPADGLLETIHCEEDGEAAFVTDVPVGAKLVVQEVATDDHYILLDTQFPVVFEYAGQEVATVHITVNDDEKIGNELKKGTVKGLKIDRETDATIAGALFGLFKADETDFTEETALLTAESKEDGVFTFENVPYGEWIVRELKPAEGYLENNENYPVKISEDEEAVDITVENDQIPELHTTATVNGKKEITVNGTVTIEDMVWYTHLIPGKEYVVKGVLMDKATGKPFLVDGKEVRSEVTFTPDTASGAAKVTFSFDGSAITTDTELVVFETLYRDGVELAAHADIDDEGQTVTLHPQPAPPVPQTGDHSPWAMAGALALLGFILMSAAFALGRRKTAR